MNSATGSNILLVLMGRVRGWRGRRTSSGGGREIEKRKWAENTIITECTQESLQSIVYSLVCGQKDFKIAKSVFMYHIEVTQVS
jgi:hypothetical protein